MTFTLTQEYVRSLATPAKEGNLMPWIEACDEDVKWRMGASDEVGKGRTGVYNIAGWKEHLAPKIVACLGSDQGLKVDVQAIDVVGNKALIEGAVNGTQKADGNAYHNKFAMIIHFSPETGKIVSVNHYYDTEVENALYAAHGV